VQPAAACKAGRPAIAATVGWATWDTYYFVMQPNVLIANCGGRIRGVRIILESLTKDGTGRLQMTPKVFSAEAAKYGNKDNMIHWPQYLYAVYPGKDNSQPLQGIALIPADPTNKLKNQSRFNLMNCTQRSDAGAVDLKGISFKMTVQALGRNGRIISTATVPTIGTAVLGPFGCGQTVSTAG
jgi:hypothetical protein